MKKVILLYNFDKARLQLVKKSVLPFKAVVKSVSKNEYIHPVGYLVGAEGIQPCKDKTAVSLFDDEMIVLYGFGSEMIDVFISALKLGGVGKIDLKAIVTPGNINWNSVKLYNEIKADYLAMSSQGF